MTGARVPVPTGSSSRESSSRSRGFGEDVQHQPVVLVEVGFGHALDVGGGDGGEDVELAVGAGDIVVNHGGVRQVHAFVLVRFTGQDVVTGELVLGALQFEGADRFALQLVEL